jgi:hypothetical protein
MSKNSTTYPHRKEHRDEAYWIPAEPQQPIDYNFSLTPPIYRGKFKKGFDSRRHKFTPEDCSKGFWAAIESIIIRHPNAIMPDGRHIVCNFLKSRQLA